MTDGVSCKQSTTRVWIGRQNQALSVAVMLIGFLNASPSIAQSTNTHYNDGPIDMNVWVDSVYVGDPGTDGSVTGGGDNAEHQFRVDADFQAPGLVPNGRYCDTWVTDDWDGGWHGVGARLVTLTDAVASPKAASFTFTYIENDEFYWPWEDEDDCDPWVDRENFGRIFWNNLQLRQHEPYTNYTYTYNPDPNWPHLGLRIGYWYTTPAPAAAVPNALGAGPGDTITVRVTPPRGSTGNGGYDWADDVGVNLYMETQPGSGQFNTVYNTTVNWANMNSDLSVQIPLGTLAGDLTFRAHAQSPPDVNDEWPPQSKGFVEFTIEICDQLTEFPIVSCKNHTAYLNADGVATIQPQDVNNGVLSNCGNYSMSVSPTSFTCADIGVNDAILSVRNDELGSQCLAQVTVVDISLPQAVCSNQTVTLDAAGTGTLTASDFDGGSSDVCGNIDAHQVYASGWAHVVATWDRAGDAVLYVDGVEQARVNISSYWFNNNSATVRQIGNALEGTTPSRHWLGGIDDVQVFDRSLTPLEVKQLFDPSSVDTPPTATPSARWRFDESSGLVAVDDAGANPGTLVGFANNDAQWVPGEVGNALQFDGGNDSMTHGYTLGHAGTIAHWLKPQDPHRTSIAYYESNSGPGHDGFGDGQDLLEIHTFQSGGKYGFYYQDGSQGGSSFRLEADRSVPGSSLNFSCDDVGFHEVTMIAYDEFGNGGNCETFVEVREDVAPSAQCVAELSFEICTNGTVEITVDDIDNGSSDACSGVFTRSLDRTQFGEADVGGNMVTLTVTDRSGNQNTCMSTVTISIPDTDGDDTPDCLDGCPDDANKTAPGACGCGIPDTDSDSDGSADCNDGCPNDGNKTSPGQCGCGIEDLDSDLDGTCDNVDLCPGFDDALDADTDGVPDGCDVCGGFDDALDADSDGVPDGCDICNGFDDTIDSDGDGVPNGCDLCPGYDNTADADGDQVPDGCDKCPGFDDTFDLDLDGVPDDCDACLGFPDEFDADADGVPDLCDACPGHDDNFDTDADGIADGCDTCPGFDDGIDSDSDGIPDGCDLCSGDNEADFDQDGVIDGCDNCPDFANPEQTDCDSNGVGDVCDIYCSVTTGGNNLGFESGDFTDWHVENLQIPDQPWQVLPLPISEGNFAAFVANSGSTPGVIRIEQDMAIASDAAWLVFDYVLKWDLALATLDRTFEVHIEPAGGGTTLQADVIATMSAGTTFNPPPTGTLAPVGRTGMVDVSDFAESTVRVAFVWTVPEADVGVAASVLDHVRSRASGAACRVLDSDNDMVPDTCDSCPNTLSDVDVDSEGCAVIYGPGDCNFDHAVDLSDYAMLEACLSGPQAGLDMQCDCFDFDVDGDNDLSDFSEFQLLMMR